MKTKSQKLPRQLKRGSVRKTGSTLMTAWVPKELAEAVDALVAKRDTDRSKLIRHALRRALEVANV